MAGERDRRRRERSAAIVFLPVAAVLGVVYEPVLAVVVEAVRPAEVRSFRALPEIFRRPFGVLLRREFSRPHRVEAVAVVHHEPQQVVVPREADFLPQTGHPALAVGRLLSEPVLVEPEDAAVGVEDRTRILSDDVRLAIRLLTRVRRRS